MKEQENSKQGPMTQIQLEIPQEIHQKLMYWIDKAPGEISGLGKLKLENGTFCVLDVVLLKQENSAASTDLDPADVAKAMYELRQHEGMLNFWWHSHVHMGVFWSGTDIDTIREIGKNGFVLSTVFNKKRELLTSYYHQAQGVMPEIFINHVPTLIVESMDADVIAELDRQYEEKCKPLYNARGWYSHERWQQPAFDDIGYPTIGDKDDAPFEDYWKRLEDMTLTIENEQSKFKADDLFKEAKHYIKSLTLDKETKRSMMQELIDVYKESRKIWNSLHAN